MAAGRLVDLVGDWRESGRLRAVGAPKRKRLRERGRLGEEEDALALG